MSHYRREIVEVGRFETEDVLVLLNKRFCAMSMFSKTQLYNTKEVLLFPIGNYNFNAEVVLVTTTLQIHEGIMIAVIKCRKKMDIFRIS